MTVGDCAMQCAGLFDNHLPKKNSSLEKMEYRREVDGLRAVAVIPVILFHAGFSAFSGGFVGVDVFFVISGYLITSILLKENEEGRFSIATFYERRARRILPAFFLVALVCLPLAWLWLLPEDMERFSYSLVAVSLYLSNVLFWFTSGYFDISAELKPLLHTWSLAVEEQYYLVFPVLLLVMWKYGRRRILVTLGVIALMSLCAAQWASTHRPDAAFYLLPTRCWELLIGSFVAFYLARAEKWVPKPPVAEVLAWVGLVMLVSSIFLFDSTIPFPSAYTLLPTVGTALIILFASQGTTVGKLLSHPFPVGIGLISYSAYLWHQPLFAFARHGSIGSPSHTIFIWLVILTLVLAYLSWRFVERPFRDRARFGQRQIFAFSGVGTLVLIGVGTLGIVTGGFPGRLNESAMAISKSSQDSNKIRGSLSERVVVGSKAAVAGVLIGDSHAESMATVLDEVLAAQGRGAYVLTKAGCPPVTGLYRIDMPSYGDACHEHYEAAFRLIETDPSIEFVVVSARFTLYLEFDRFDNGEGGVERGATERVVYDGIEFKNSSAYRSDEDRRAFIAKCISEDLGRLLKSGKRVYLVYPIPEAGWDVAVDGEKLALKTNARVNLSTSEEQYQRRNRRAEKVLDELGEHPNLVRIRPESALCDTFFVDRCAAVVESQALYSDSNHLSNAGARLVLQRFPATL
ncbi:acyltransferase family protein [Pseudorhodoferax sp.]|uniref:acyltransferase family protein n=1 Tax=Pseudorhodoferax sp. TaxID=1993553 RepID=UPI0039E27F04